MSTSEPIDDLMHRWETARRQGTELSPESLCADCPQLLDALRQRIRAVVAMENLLGVTDHDPRQTMQATPDNSIDQVAGSLLPRVPGYEIIRIIDQGGMGVVYEAWQLAPKRTVAIKMISGMHLKPKTLARFHAEVAAAAHLQHPNFVHIFEVGDVQGRPFYSMEYVPGGSLAEQLKQARPDPRRAAELVETLARAVHAAHARGIVHRDLKPSNVMLTADGTPKIADFGLVKRLDDESGHTHTGEVLGTPSYMAPEQAEGKKNEIGPRTDIYALGAILYEMLAGKPPFEGASPLDAMRQVVTREPVHPSRFVPATPRDLEAICLKCLEKAPGHRYATALTLADDLRRFLDGQPVTARHLGPMGRFAKAIRRHPQAAALAVLLFILALVPVYLFADNYFTQRQIQRNNEEAERQRKLRAVELAPLVREILHRNCYECHGHDPKKVEKNLNILNYDHLLEKKRHVVVPGAPDDSLLIQRIDDGSMPPAELELRLPRVSEEERATLRDWILGGAPPLPRDDSGQAGLTTAPRSELAAQAKKIFHEHCYKCHEHRKAEGGIRIMHHRLLVTQRKVVIPGQPEQSKLYKRLITDDDEERMPPDFPLQPEEIEVVRRWIAEGALPFPKTD